MSETGNKLLDAALKFAAGGFWVFPLEPHGKRPQAGTHGFKDATTNSETIKAWWAKTPEANVGIDCERSGLVVLDIDVKGGKDARPAIEGHDLAGAVVVQTPSGGLHYYWRANGEPFQGGSNLYDQPGLDIRARGGFIVAPPSAVDLVDEATGGTTRKAYHVLSGRFGDIGPVPQWLVDLERERQAKKAAPVAEAGPVTARQADPELLDRARAYVGKMPASISGQGGHVRLLKACTALVVGFQLSDDDAMAVVSEDFNSRCEPPWSNAELLHKISEARTNATGRRPGYLLEHGLPLRNYRVETRQVGRKQVEVPVPRLVGDIRDEVLARFGGFPKRLGSRLFYLDGEDGTDVAELPTQDSLAAWVGRMGGCGVDFKSGAGFPSVNVVREAILQTAECFNGTSMAPWFPARKDVFDLCGELPEPSKGHEAFWKVMEFMNPATEADFLLMSAFFCSPMYFSPNGEFDRPAWLVDTQDAQGSGKTSTAEVCSRIYSCTPLALDFASLDRSQEAVKKRIISSEGRGSRVALFDNIVAKTIKSPVLAALITSKYITERAAYGRGEESRPNDLTWCFTVNSGTLDTDLATRTYPVVIKAPDHVVPFWKKRVLGYIDTNRKQILSDIRDMLRVALDRVEAGEVWTREKSRFSEFDAVVLGAVCSKREDLALMDQRITEWMTEANDDRDRAERFETALLKDLAENNGGVSDESPLVLFASDVDAVIADNPELQRLRPAVTAKDLRMWIKSGLLPAWSKDFRKIQHGSKLGPDFGAAAFLYGTDRFVGDGAEVVQVVRRTRNTTTFKLEWRTVNTINTRRMP